MSMDISSIAMLNNISSSVEKLKASENSEGAAFASALQDEIQNLSGISDSAALSAVLPGAAALGTTTNLTDLSEMLASKSGRQAINAMAENSLSSIVTASGEDDNDGTSSMLSKLLDSEHDSGEQMTKVLTDLMEILNTSSEKNEN